MALSDSWLKANSGKEIDKAYEKADRDGLSVRVSPKGKLTFQLRYRYIGKASRLDLGSYPATSLKSARTECLRLKGELEKGYDPKLVKINDRIEIENAPTISDLFYRWHSAKKIRNEKCHKQVLRSFEIHLLPRIGMMLVQDTKLHTWLTVLDDIAKGTPAVAASILANAKKMLGWGVRMRLISDNTLSDISAREDLHVVKRVGKRSLSNDEIVLLWDALRRSRVAPKNKVFIKLHLFFACRTGELRLAEKSHFDFDKMVWTVPAENHKTGYSGNQIVRPIVPEIVPLLKEAFLLSSGKFLFGSADSFSEKTDSEAKPLASTSHLSIVNVINNWINKHHECGITHWSIHDLRKTARTNFSDLTDERTAEVMLGHKLPGIQGVYDHNLYLKTQAAAYTAWHHRLCDIIGSEL